MKKIKLGISGAGCFAECFIPLFKAHPNVGSVVLAEILPERRSQIAAKYAIDETCDSHESLCDSNVDAIAIFTQRHLHAPQALHALSKGKHVYCAVPACGTVQEAAELVKTVQQTGLIYMMGETSYYYPTALFCRGKFQKGQFGSFVYGEGEYYHDMAHGFYDAFQHSGGDQWKKVAGFPPMYYPTHSTSMILSVTGSFLTQVSCLGYVDTNEDRIFGAGNNLWDNPFSNQTALFRTSDGGMCRINEFRRIGLGIGHSVRTSLYGTQGCFEEQGNSRLWTTHDKKEQDVTSLLDCVEMKFESGHELKDGQQADFYSGVTTVHPVQRLPKEFSGLPNGHFGSHQFLVDDFLRSVVQNKLAPNHVWAAVRYTVPGIIAHESAQKEGQLLQIPDFGYPPAHYGYIAYD